MVLTCFKASCTFVVCTIFCRSSLYYKTYFADQFLLLSLFECSIIFNNWVLFDGGSVRARYPIQNDLYSRNKKEFNILCLKMDFLSAQKT